MASFWEGLGQGMLETGVGLYQDKLRRDAAAKQMRAAQGPLYDTQFGMAGKSLALAGSTDPKALAAERFAAQQALIEPSNKAQEQEVLRRLQKTGMLGAATFGAVPGTTQTPGVAVNPQLAALYAAQAGARSRAAYESLGEGENYLNRLLERSGMLTGQAQGTREAGQLAQMRQSQIPAQPSTREKLIRGAGQVILDPKKRSAVFGAAKQIPGMLGQAGGWLSGLFGGGGGRSVAPAFNYDFDGFNF